MEVPLAGMESAAILMVGIRLSPSGRESKRVHRHRAVRPGKMPWETMPVARERPKAKVFSQQPSAFSLSSYATISIEQPIVFELLCQDHFITAVRISYGH